MPHILIVILFIFLLNKNFANPEEMESTSSPEDASRETITENGSSNDSENDSISPSRSTTDEANTSETSQNEVENSTVKTTSKSSAISPYAAVTFTIASLLLSKLGCLL